MQEGGNDKFLIGGFPTVQPLRKW